MYRALAEEASRRDEPTSTPQSHSRNTSTPAGALQATISRYFDEGPRRSSAAVDNSQRSHGSSSSSDRGDKPDAVASTSVTSSTVGVTPSSSSTTTPLPRLPHEPLDERACDTLVRDASVLVSDPSFRGRISFEDDGLGWRAGEGGGVGVGGGASGMAPHAWLLKVRKGRGAVLLMCCRSETDVQRA